MTEPRRPGDLSHLERLIDRWSKTDTDDPATAGRLRRLIALSALVAMLDGLVADGEPRLAFKGGAALELRFGARARASRNVDALVNVSLDDAFVEIAERLTDGWEGFVGRLTERTAITRAGIDPAPERCQVKLLYRGRPFYSLPFELGYAEAGSFRFVERLPSGIDLDRVQLGPTGEVTVLNVHYQIAQKLHACTEIPNEGENPRVHDLYDILLIVGLAESDGLHHTRAACDDTFTHRNRHKFPPPLPLWDSWPTVWAALDIPDDARYPYEVARASVEDLILRIANA